MAKRKTNIWIDAEWFIHQQIFLIGYAYSTRKCHQLYGRRLTKLNFRRALKKVDGFVFGYGPDVGMCEKHFGWKFRRQYRCVNLMKPFRKFVTTFSYKLKDLEILFKLRRRVVKYKQNIFTIWRDWRNNAKRKLVLQYNVDDVINLVKLTRIIFKKYKVSTTYLNSIRLT